MNVLQRLLLSFITLSSLLSVTAPACASPNSGGVLLFDQEYDQTNFFWQPTISTLTILNRANFFKAGDTIYLELTGTPHARASVSIEGVCDSIPMSEVSVGRYRGQLVVPSGVLVYDARLIGHLALNHQGNRSAEAVGTVSVTDGTVFVHVAPPANMKQPVHGTLKVRGNTVPNAQLRITATYPADGTNAGETVSSNGVASVDGYFNIPLHFNRRSSMDARQIEMTVVASDPITSQSRTVEFRLAAGE